MMKKIRRLVQSINQTKIRVDSIEKQNKEIEKIIRENHWANIFNSAISGSHWFKNVPLNVGRWAGSYSLFYVLYRILNEVKPNNILELGLGETTKMIQAYKRDYNKDACCTTIEQNQEWIDLRIKNDISREYINLLNVETEDIIVNEKSTLVYKNLFEELSPQSSKFNLILIDGPWGSVNYSRYNVVELIEKDLIDDDFIILLDDFDREGEKQTAERIKKTLTEVGKTFEIGMYMGAKTQKVIVSPEFKYLISL